MPPKSAHSGCISRKFASGTVAIAILIALLLQACGSGSEQPPGTEPPGTVDAATVSPQTSTPAPATDVPAPTQAPISTLTVVPTSVTAPASPSGQITIEGTFTTIVGDPPAGPDQRPRREASLVDGQGQRWQLTFDDTVYRFPGTLLQLNNTRVRVIGSVTGPNAVVVLSLTPL